MAKQGTILVNTTTVSCEGSEGGLGHPKVYLKIKETQINCPYCSKIFILRKVE